MDFKSLSKERISVYVEPKRPRNIVTVLVTLIFGVSMDLRERAVYTSGIICWVFCFFCDEKFFLCE